MIILVYNGILMIYGYINNKSACNNFLIDGMIMDISVRLGRDGSLASVLALVSSHMLHDAGILTYKTR